MANEDDNIDPARDARESTPEWAREKRKYIRPPTEAELDTNNYFHIPGVTPECLVFPGDYQPAFVSRDMGAVLQAVKVERVWQVHSVKPGSKNKWLKLLGEYSTKPEAVWREKWEGGPGLFTPEGHKVDRVAYLGVVRRNDPTVYTIRFSSMEMNVFDDWFAIAHKATLPFYGSRWRWRQVDVGDTYGTHEWAFERLGAFRDGSPEAPTTEEYRAARAIERGEATEMPMSAFPQKRGGIIINEKPANTADTRSVSADDEIPF